MTTGRLGLRGLAGLLLLVLGAPTACRRQSALKETESQANAASLILPRKTADAVPGTDVPLTFDIDEKTGRTRVSLVLRLDYFPDPKPGVTNLPVCYRPFPEDFDLGVAVCDGKADVRLPILAKNVDQDCYTDPAMQRVTAAQPLVIPGCRKGGLLVHSFDPRLRIDLEVRDPN